MPRQHHHSSMNEAATESGRPQMWILFRRRDAYVPDPFPDIVQRFVNRINARVVRGDRVVLIDADAVLMGEFAIESHLILQEGFILEKMGLGVAEHVTEPPELVGVRCGTKERRQNKRKTKRKQVNIIITASIR